MCRPETKKARLEQDEIKSENNSADSNYDAEYLLKQKFKNDIEKCKEFLHDCICSCKRKYGLSRVDTGNIIETAENAIFTTQRIMSFIT